MIKIHKDVSRLVNYEMYISLCQISKIGFSKVVPSSCEISTSVSTKK